ncbi:MAG: SDR family NAD(P)-dependent oxidoreductase, partial [Kordiimonadaceae bacterium]|nr:SDR family NAD(P)-dependent oxidoreductase [Kordiimonadaceae bacterium]
MTSSDTYTLKARMAAQLEAELLERAQKRCKENANMAALKASRTPDMQSSAPKLQITPKEPDEASRLAFDVARLAGEALHIPEDQLDPTENLANFGVDSIAITEVMLRISRFFGISVAPTTFFEAKHLDDLSAILQSRYGKAIAAFYDKQPQKDEAVSDVPQPQAWTAPKAWLKRHQAAQVAVSIALVGASDAAPGIASKKAAETASKLQGQASPVLVPEAQSTPNASAKGRPAPRASNPEEPIAVISMEGAFPRSADIAALAVHLQNGDDCIEEVPADRWDWRSVDGDPKKGPYTPVKYGGFVPQHDRFDAAFFNISPREAELIDPQHRVFMTSVWKLIEKAGYASGSLSGKKVSIFLGINLLDHVDAVNRAGIMDARQMTGLGHAFCPNRLSYMLDVHGPSQVVDTACSSSLVAIHRAVMSIRHEGCEMAIAGGANLMLSANQHILFSKTGMLAEDGRSKTFSQQADGYGRADGVGALLLKPLRVAERDGDQILGVITGSAEQHSGQGSSLTAPNSAAQARMIVEAHRRAEVDPRSIGYVECHGTGTPLGDPAEVEGLKLAFAQRYEDLGLDTPTTPYVGLGTVKSNIGHTETAAGVAGVIKTLLSLQQRTLFKTLHCADVNPLLELDDTPFYLMQEAGAWNAAKIDGKEVPRRACVSSFGAGGGNAHIVLEEYQPPAPERCRDTVVTRPVVIPLSAKSATALGKMAGNLRAFVVGISLDDLAYTLQVGRDAMRYRAAFVALSSDDLLTQIDAFIGGQNGPDNSEIIEGVAARGSKITVDPKGHDPVTLARKWAEGATVNWDRLYAKTGNRRIQLPTYPFDTKKFSLPGQAPEGCAPADVVPSIPRLLLPTPAGENCFSLTLSGDEFFLRDHQVMGKAILPGVAYLEMVRASAAQILEDTIQLSNVVWLKPLVIEARTTLNIEFSKLDEGALQARIYHLTEAGGRTEHAQVKVKSAQTAEMPMVDIAAIQATHQQHHEASQVYSVFASMGLVYGPGHQSVADISVGTAKAGGRQVLGRLVLPGVVPQEADSFGLHPSLMDGAFQAVAGMVLQADGSAPQETALPFALDSLVQFGPWESNMWVHIQTASLERAGSQIQKADIDLIGGDGTVRVRIEGFTARKAVNKQAPAMGAHLFQPVWQPLEDKAHVPKGFVERHLYLAEEFYTDAKWHAAREGWGIHSLGAYASGSLAETYGHLATQLLAGLQGLTKPARMQPTLLQILVPEDIEREPLTGLTGMIRSAAKEYAALHVQFITANPDVTVDALLRNLDRAIAAPSGARLRISNAGVQQAVWEHSSVLKAKAVWALRDNAAYLITGGSGGIARLLTRYILDTTAEAAIILASRSPLDLADAVWLTNSERARVRHITVDVADMDSVSQLVADIDSNHQQISGVFHAAGVLDDKALSAKSAASLAKILAPKVAGVENLDKALGTQPLDFMILFSSISSALGNPGQTDYAAANGFMDGYALMRDARRERGLCFGTTVSIAWPLWQDGGMEMAKSGQTNMTRLTGLTLLQTDDALAAMEAIMRSDAGHCLVTSGNLDQIHRLVKNEDATKIVASKIPEKGVNASQSIAQINTTESLQSCLMSALKRIVSEQLKVSVEDLDPEEQLPEYGFDSIGFAQLANALNEHFSLDIIPTLFFECPTLRELSEYLISEHGDAVITVLGGATKQPTVEDSDKGREAVEDAFEAKSQPFTPRAPTAISELQDEAIAIVGMSGQFPQAPNLEVYWRNLSSNLDAISEIPEDRWNWKDYWGDPLSQPGRTNIKWGGFIDNVGAFDPDFFGISRPEARLIDPQQRLLLTEAWRLMEDAGYAPHTLSGSNTGVFIGTADSAYGRIVADDIEKIEGYTMAGLAPSLGPNRISYYYNLRGPSVAVETACSSALVAVHRAIEAIEAGRCDSAIAGGINLLLSPHTYVGFSKAGMLSPEGRCKTFGADANGYARGEGVGLVYLKKLSAAKRDGDRILAVVRASGENHGGRASSLTAPNPKAQAELLRDVYSRAGFDPRTVGYIEAHGTGTPMGDPIEVEALKVAFDDLGDEAQSHFGEAAASAPCGIGSVKSNIGHLEIAAGIAGLIKLVLQIRNATLVKSLHCEDLNPYLKLDDSAFYVVDKNQPWVRTKDQQGQSLPYRAGVSSFGFGGSNAHIVVEEYIDTETVAAQETAHNSPQMIVLSARTENQLREWAGQLRSAVADSQAGLTSIAHTLQASRDAMEHRLAFVCETKESLITKLDTYLSKGEDQGLYTGQIKGNRETISILETDATLRNATEQLVQQGSFDSLLALWVRGFNVNWANMSAGENIPKAMLPGYPFDKTIYWGAQTAPKQARSNLAPIAPSSVRQEAAATAPVGASKHILETLVNLAAQVLEVEVSVLDVDVELGDFGFDSIVMTTFAGQVNEALGLGLSPADFFEYSTLSQLSEHIGEAEGIIATPVAPVTPVTQAPSPPEQTPEAAPVSSSPSEHSSMSQSLEDDPVVIVGYSCNFPGAPDAASFWRSLEAGKETITRIPEDRWDWQAVHGDPKTQAGKTDIHWGGFCDGVFEFDPLFFNISPREAVLMDPQQRLLMMHVWNAIEDAGHAPTALAGQKVGIFAGTAASDYRHTIADAGGNEGYVATGSVASIGPNRMSYFLDFHGPSEPVETACSSSLVALHRAVRSLYEGECDMALAGGVNTILTPDAHVNFSKAGMLSPDGHCKTFSDKANGYVRGEGVGVLYLKRLSAAERDGDSVRAIIRGSGVNHGGRANSLTAPNTVAQASLLRDVYASAGIDPSHLGYIEAHGTGTGLGDPVEINGLKSAFGAASDQAGQPNPSVCGIGSVKTNIGHLELAAGVAGIIKVLLQLEHKTLVPSLNCTEINPHITLEGTPFEIIRNKRPWAAITDAAGKSLPRLAGVSSFGFGGVNAHIVLEEYKHRPAKEAPSADFNSPAVFVLSAKNSDALRRRAQDLYAVLDTNRFGDTDRDNMAYTLQVGRTAMASRLAVVSGSLTGLRDLLQVFLKGGSDACLFEGDAAGRGQGQHGQDNQDNQDASSLAVAWVSGQPVNWPMPVAGTAQRLVLPHYPFARDTYNASCETVAPASNATKEIASAAEGNPASGIILEAEAFYLKDHNVRGQRILPGAMGLELVRSAFAGAQNLKPVILKRVSWRRPLVLDVGCMTAEIKLTVMQEKETAFALCGEDGGADYMRGVITEPALGEAVPQLDIEGALSKAPRVISRDWLYDGYEKLGIIYGPTFRVVDKVWAGQDTLVARLCLPEITDASGTATNGDAFAMHPAMLEGAFHAVLALFADDTQGTIAFPVGVDALSFLAPTASKMWAVLRVQSQTAGMHKIDIDLVDDAGQVCIAVEGFSLRELPLETTAKPAAVPAKPSSSENEGIEQYFKALVSRHTDIPVDTIELAKPLEQYGIDSLLISQLTTALEDDFGPIPTTLFFEHLTLASLVGYFVAEHSAALAAVTGVKQPAGSSPLVTTPDAVKFTKPSDDCQDIAIIGLAGRYPQAQTVDEFWQNLVSGRDSITEVPITRWDHASLQEKAGQNFNINSKWGGFVDDIDKFDPLFLNISPAQAHYMDPQERLFMQCAWETLEDAGYTRETLAPSLPPMTGGNVGVFVGVMWQEYQLYGAERLAAGAPPLALSGNSASVANRVSHFCNFQGPSIAVDTMCSSSLTAIHLACASLRSGGCSVALAGGVNLTVHPNKYIGLAQGNFLSSTGRCESFGKGGDGYVPSEGVGSVLLKPLAQAVADKDQIYGVIQASSLNHGGTTNGYTVPNPNAQAALIQRTMDMAGVSPEAISYVEAHGTGTALGDPIEIAALTKAYRRQTTQQGYCAIGSVKSNIGHGESAAGIAGLSKIMLQFKHGKLVPSLHAETLNPGIDFDKTPFVVQRQLGNWNQPEINGQLLPRIAGLSSFGAGGANAHLILAEYQQAVPDQADAQQFLFPFSAHDEGALQLVLKRFRARLETLAPQDLAAAAYVLQHGREGFKERLAIVATGKGELARCLDGILGLDGILVNAGANTQAHGTFRGQAKYGGEAVDVPPTDLYDTARLWVVGAATNWSQFWHGPVPGRISLPTYPFKNARYWIPGEQPNKPEAESRIPVPLLYVPDWQVSGANQLDCSQQGYTNGGASKQDWLILCGVSDALCAEIQAATPDANLLVLPGGDKAVTADIFADHAARLMAMLQERLKENTGRCVVQLLVPADRDGKLFTGLGGMLRTVSQETHHIYGQLISLEGRIPEDIALLLQQDRASAEQDPDVKYLHGQRLVRKWRELDDISVLQSLSWKPGGVYLITGGAGGIGLHIASEMAASGRKPVLWLFGRSPLSTEKVAQLEALPARVNYRQVDVSDGEAVAALVAEIRQCDGRIDGVVHSAGLTRDGIIARKTAKDLQAVLSPKVAGLMNLDAAIGDEPLDFMLLMASVSGALGNAGQADYATANAFLDGFAEYRNQQVVDGLRCGHTLSVDWPYWRDGGLQLDAKFIQDMGRQYGVLPLEHQSALLVLQFGMKFQDLSQMLVLNGDHNRLRKMMQPSSVAVSADKRAALFVPKPKVMASAMAGSGAGAISRGQSISTHHRFLTELVTTAFAQVLQIDPEQLDMDMTIDRFGVDSVYSLTIIEHMEKVLGTLPPTLLFEYATINKLIEFLATEFPPATLEATGDAVGVNAVETPSGPAHSLGKSAGVDTPNSGTTHPAAAAQDKDIAIIAVSGRYPDADNTDALWKMMAEGGDGITEVPPERWDMEAIYSSSKGKPGSSHSKWGGFIKDIDCFDAAFFDFTPREADLSDPQVRLFLETTWHLMERAGHTRTHLKQHYNCKVGMFVGAMYQQYNAFGTDPDSQSLLMLSSYAAIANRASFFFDMQGPSVAVDSMCSSGLQAVHQACQSLHSGECRLAVAGGVNLSIHPGKYIGLSRLGLMGSHDQSRAFAKDADGYLPSEGVGAVLLKPLADAVRDRDNVLGVIKGSSANHAGHSAGFAVPNIDAQAQLIEENLQQSGVDVRQIGYIEASANGSPVGDSIELRALKRVYNSLSPEQKVNCTIGSVKSNIGHAEAASGLAQLTRVLLQFEHKKFAPSFNNQMQDEAALIFADTPFAVQNTLTPWTQPYIDGQLTQRCAAISSFGAGGSNVHLVLQEAPEYARRQEQAPENAEAGYRHPFLFTARTPEQLETVISQMEIYIAQNQYVPIARVAQTLQLGREQMACSITLVARDREELLAQMQAFRDGRHDALTAPSDSSVNDFGQKLEHPLDLPAYPFARDRHWIKHKELAISPEEARVMVASVLDGLIGIVAREQGVDFDTIDPAMQLRALGVDSMIGMQLIHHIEETTGLVIGHQDLDQLATLRQLAEQLDSKNTRQPYPLESRNTPLETAAAFGPISGPWQCEMGEGQKGIWVAQIMQPESSAYNVPLAFKTKGIDKDLLSAACFWLLDRYPILSARVDDVADQPRLVAKPVEEVLSILPTPKAIDILAFVRHRAARPFDMAKEAKVRFELLTQKPLEQEEGLLLILAHHLVVDGVSMAVLGQELWRVYEQLLAGVTPSSPSYHTQADYAHFVAWEQEYAASDKGQGELAYWREHLSGELPVLDLPPDCVPSSGGLDGQTLEIKLPAIVVAAASATARRLGISQASYYLGLFAILLYRYTGQSEMIVGVPTLRRPKRFFENTIGYCANMIAVRMAVEGQMPTEGVLKTIHNQLTEGIDHASYPFAAIAREFSGATQGKLPYQVTYAYQNFAQGSGEVHQLAKGEVSFFPQLRQGSDCALGLDLFEDAKGLSVVAAYDGGRFSQEMMKTLLKHFQELVAEVATRPERPVANQGMLSELEQNQLLQSWSGSENKAPSGPLVIDAFRRQVKKTPKAVALIFEGTEI